MKVLILGGTRNVGKCLVEELLGDPKVSHLGILSRREPTHHQKLQWYQGDRNDERLLESVAAEHHWDVLVDFLSFDASDAELICAHFAPQVSRFLIISSQAVYPAGKNLPVSSFDPTDVSAARRSLKRNQAADQEYSAGKRAMECTFYGLLHDRVEFVRMAPVISSGDPRFIRQLEKVRSTRTLVCQNATARISIVNKFYAAALIKKIIESRVQTIYNIAAPDTISMTEVAAHISAHDGIRIAIEEKHLPTYSDPYSVHTAWEDHEELFFLSITEDWSIEVHPSLLHALPPVTAEDTILEALAHRSDPSSAPVEGLA